MDTKKREKLVAYLDGELNESEAEEVNRWLSDDPDLRREIESYSRTWEMLELMPAGAASDTFAQRTLTAMRSGQAETIAEQDLDTAAPGRPSISRRIGIRIAGFLGLILVAQIGFRAGFNEGSEPINQLLRDFRMLEKLDQYQEAESVEFLQEIQKRGVFDGNR